MYHVLTR
ncbi:hypothetical protein BsWGS_16987 [Bradybaena similaris]